MGGWGWGRSSPLSFALVAQLLPVETLQSKAILKASQFLNGFPHVALRFIGGHRVFALFVTLLSNFTH